MKVRIWIALIAVYITWGSTYLAIRFAVESLPPFLMAATRNLIAGLALYTWRRLSGDKPPTRLEWRATAIVGLLLLLGGNGLVSWAEQRVPSGITALLIGSIPLWFVALDALRPGGTRPGWKTMLGVLIGLAGIILLIGPDELAGNGHGTDLLGAAALLFAALLWATGSLYGRGARLPASPLLSTSMEMLTGGLSLLCVGTLTGEWGRLDLGAANPRAWLGLVCLIIFGSLIAYSAYTWLLKNAPTPLVATYAYVNPLVAIFLGNWLAQEPLTPRILVSALIIIGAVILINRR